MVAEPDQTAYYVEMFGETEGLSLVFEQNLNIINLAQVQLTRPLN